MIFLLNEKGEKPKTVSPAKVEKLLAEGKIIAVPKKKDTYQKVTKAKQKAKKPPMQFSKLMVIVSMSIIVLAYLLNALLSWFDKGQVEMGVPLATAF